MKKATKVVTVLGAAAALGALFGILYAPDKGTRTRKKIARKYKHISDTVEDTINERRDQLTELKEDIEEQLERIQSKMKQKACK